MTVRRTPFRGRGLQGGCRAGERRVSCHPCTLRSRRRQTQNSPVVSWLWGACPFQSRAADTSQLQVGPGVVAAGGAAARSSEEGQIEHATGPAAGVGAQQRQLQAECVHCAGVGWGCKDREGREFAATRDQTRKREDEGRREKGRVPGNEARNDCHSSRERAGRRYDVPY